MPPALASAPRSAIPAVEGKPPPGAVPVRLRPEHLVARRPVALPSRRRRTVEVGGQGRVVAVRAGPRQRGRASARAPPPPPPRLTGVRVLERALSVPAPEPQGPTDPGQTVALRTTLRPELPEPAPITLPQLSS
ncbi:hypothetical protein FIBSPDRAFT_968878 [Athelia psychrophila]|uniref:Uncharacterized protein n=1 Tax=Athelia psychrophila TaxID=1759441 RepID=A0A167U428_9AGAM|nr:hypothetical protein FIBSPDRAFT_968878 [Fibularhizoctonia sp. CBS 109695]